MDKLLHLIIFIFCICLVAPVCFGGATNDPDIDRDVVQLIESRGFQSETHDVTTADGYILTIHRIVNTKIKAQNKRPIILQHGLVSSGIDFIINSPGLGTEHSSTLYKNQTVSKNLGFALSMFGYDVWLTNSRGNAYGLRHVTLKPEEKEFWEFTFDQMVQYDLPATINYILKETNHASLGYIGHSQGTLIMFCLLSTQTQYANIVKPFIALAPVTKLVKIESPIKYFDSFITRFALYTEGGPFLTSSELVNKFKRQFCGDGNVEEICSNLLFTMVGFNEEQLNKTRLPVYTAHSPSSTSAWNIVHYGQLLSSRKFQKFHKNYDLLTLFTNNNNSSVPEYDLSQITSTNIALFHSQNDWLATPENVDFIRETLQGKVMVDYKVPNDKWNHMDFLWGKHTPKYVYKKVLKILDQFA